MIRIEKLKKEKEHKEKAEVRAIPVINSKSKKIVQQLHSKNLLIKQQQTEDKHDNFFSNEVKEPIQVKEKEIDMSLAEFRHSKKEISTYDIQNLLNTSQSPKKNYFSKRVQSNEPKFIKDDFSLDNLNFNQMKLDQYQSTELKNKEEIQENNLLLQNNNSSVSTMNKNSKVNSAKKLRYFQEFIKNPHYVNEDIAVQQTNSTTTRKEDQPKSIPSYIKSIDTKKSLQIEDLLTSINCYHKNVAQSSFDPSNRVTTPCLKITDKELISSLYTRPKTGTSNSSNTGYMSSNHLVNNVIYVDLKNMKSRDVDKQSNQKKIAANALQSKNKVKASIISQKKRNMKSSEAIQGTSSCSSSRSINSRRSVLWPCNQKGSDQKEANSKNLQIKIKSIQSNNTSNRQLPSFLSPRNR